MSAAFCLRGPNKRADGVKIINEIKIADGIKIADEAITINETIIIKRTREIIINSLIFG